MKVFKSIVLWVLAVFFVLTAFAFLPHISGFLALLTAALLFPVAKWQDILLKFIKKTLKTILVVILALATIFAVPGGESADVISDSAANGTTTTTTYLTDQTTLASDAESTVVASTTKPNTTITKVVTTSTVVVTTTTVAPAITTKKTATTTKALKTTTKKPVTTTTKRITTTTEKRTTYVLNTESKKFHHITCKRLPTKNREDVTMSREEIVSMGYEPCGFCKP